MTKVKIPFDLDKAKPGMKIVTRCGYPVKLIDYPIKNNQYPLLGIISKDEQKEEPASFTNTGNYHFGHEESEYDLFLEIEIEEKIRRMTNYELAKWLAEENGHFKQKKYGSIIETSHWYHNEDEDEEVHDDILIREDKGEWRKPLIKVEEEAEY